MAHLATRDLQRAAQKGRGRKFSETELADIRLEVAKEDHQTRQDNLENKGHIGVTGRDTVRYHDKVFDKWGLPKNTFTPAHMQNLVGAYWSKVLGGATRDARDLVHRLIRSVHEDMKSTNVFKLLESVRVNHSSVSVH